MNKLFYISTALLVGCTMFTSTSSYDPVLYSKVIMLWSNTQATNNACGTSAIQPQILALNRESNQLLKYTQYADKDLNASVALVDKAISEMKDVYSIGTPSTAYCKIKLEIIDNEIDAVLHGLGEKSK